MEPDKKINLIIADDNERFIEALCVLISKEKKFNILETFKNGLELINSRNLARADLLLLDIQMPEMDGVGAARWINARYPDMPMIAISMHEDWAFVEDSMNSGFKGHVPKREIHIKLFEVIELVLNNKTAFPFPSKTFNEI